MDQIGFTSPSSLSVEQRHSRIKSVLTEIRKEKPLGKCPLFKMTLTFRSFVWAPIIESMYCHSVTSLSEKSSQKETVSPIVKKPLLRSHSATSLKSDISKLPTLRNPTESFSKNQHEKNIRKDVVRLNMLSAIANSAIKLKTQSRNLQPDIATNRSHKLGTVPKYLTSRKAEWARQEEEKLKNLPDPDCPPGHVMMPEVERLETLTRLQQSQKELVEEFNRLPLSKDSLRFRQKKEDIERQLTKVEEGIRVLSKPKVFVRIDN